MNRWSRLTRNAVFGIGGCVVLVGAVATWAQQDLRTLLGAGASPKKADALYKVTLEPADAKVGDTVKLVVDVTLPDDSHTYSMSLGFSGRTRVEIASSEGLEEVEKEFTANKKPVVKDDPLLGQKVETFKGNVTWSRTYRLAPGKDPQKAMIAGVLKIQICDATSCRPVQHKFSVALGGPAGPKFETQYAPQILLSGEQRRPSTWTARLNPPDAKPGDVVTMSVTAKLAKEYHTFALDHDPKAFGNPTLIQVSATNGLEPLNEKHGFVADRKAEEHMEEGKKQRFFHNEVTWTQKFRVTPAATKSGYGIAGQVRYQLCSGLNCLRPQNFDYALGTIDPKSAEPTKAQAAISGKGSGQGGGSGNDLTSFLDGMTYRDAGRAAGAGSASLLQYLFFAFIGGLILNVMPCVLPVIAIKALSFVQQAGESRARILTLNLAYSAGVIAVFVLLATLAVTAGLSWGGLFQQVGFNIAMCALVFAMGLSLLGVYEIPIPGFVGSAAGSQHKEGPSGAFLTGIFATLLATPCSGPFLGTTLGWSVKQSPLVIYLVWTMMGLGMASPYLIFAIWPRAVKLLPKPGNWMVTFKQIAGFVLMATTVYLLSIVDSAYLMPTLVMLLGIGLGLWMIGTFYDYSSTPRRRWSVRTAALVATAGISWIGFDLWTAKEKLDWKPFRPAEVAQALRDGKPVMIDFTADWCLTCKVVERTTLNTDATALAVEKHGIVSFRADWSDDSDEIRAVLNHLGGDSIPVLAVFSPTRPKEPVILRDAWTQSMLLSVLNEITEGLPPGVIRADVGQSSSNNLASR